MTETSVPPSPPPPKTIVFNGTTYSCPFADLLPPLQPEERADLMADIQRRGIVVPVVIDGENNVIDGHNRLEIAAELQLTDVPVKVKDGLSQEQRRDLALNLNLHRRHLTREQRRELIAQALKADPEKSDRQIAEQVKVHHETVGAMREQLESTGEIRQLARTKGKDGRKRRAKKKTPRATTAAAGAHSRRTPAPTPTLLPRSDTAAAGAAAPPSTPALKNWPRLESHGRGVQEIGKAIAKLALMKVVNRTPEAVRKQLNSLRQKLDEMDCLFPAEGAATEP